MSGFKEIYKAFSDYLELSPDNVKAHEKAQDKLLRMADTIECNYPQVQVSFTYANGNLATMTLNTVEL